MVLDLEAASKLSILTIPETRIILINSPMIGACLAYQRVCQELGASGAMTGAARERVYAKEPLHLQGFAWDFRSRAFPDPYFALTLLGKYLRETSPCYRAVYISPPKPAHFHVEYDERRDRLVKGRP